ncbi:cation:proton antiporter [Dyella soli]|uniref:Sodium:proton antiporter n=1 Tax=Dyella soli TaxID=522319 RepID=A0A4R0YT36_9GAMM|nr:sodium:proton antiporter [Dyella soli]TCI09642.1 sodium:proton antiporter [Dyella soli]
MQVFETVLALLLGAALVSSLARRLHIPYPTVLAVGGALVALLPHGPSLDFPPSLILAIFVAPVLMEAAFSTSLRDLWESWDHVLALVVVAVALTTAAVAVVARYLLPGMPWPVAIALGALLAPPDAVAATAVLRQISLPLRIRTVLEGESLLNDASALLIYKVSVSAVVAGSFGFAQVMPTFALVVLGSVVIGLVLAWPASWLMERFEDAPSAVIFQFGLTFGLWLASEHLGLSPVVVVVAFALTLARKVTHVGPAHVRLASFAIWDSATVILNVLGFTLIGLQLRPILEALSRQQRVHSLAMALILLAVVIGVRLALVLVHHVISRLRNPSDVRTSSYTSSAGGALAVGWSGMRGIVTLAAAMALPTGFPYRDFIQLTAFVVVLGTLLIHGLTLRPLLGLVRLPPDDTVQQELARARKTALRAALAELRHHDTTAAERLRQEITEALRGTQPGLGPAGQPEARLRRQLVTTARLTIDDLRNTGIIGDDAYRQVETELDWMELSASAPIDQGPTPSP